MSRLFRGLPVLTRDEFQKLRDERRAQGGDLYEVDLDDDDEDGEDDDDIPEGCRACGGPYPDCSDSCPIYGDN